MPDALETTLREMAESWAQSIQQKANAANGKPAHIKVTAKVSGASGGAIGMNIDAVSPKGDARAYEYGSGIHSTSKRVSPKQEGVKGKIIIAPVKAPVLAFYWQPLKKYPPGTVFRNPKKLIAVPEEGKGLFNYVEHPGVKAANSGKGYLRPAISEVRKKMRKDIPKATREACIGGIRKAFKKS